MSASFRLCLGVCLAAVHFAEPFNVSAQEAPKSDTPQIQFDKEASKIPFQRVEDAFLSVPVRINDRIDTYFILDTGVGVTILSKAIADQLGLKVTGTHVGRRMSGQ